MKKMMANTIRLDNTLNNPCVKRAKSPLVHFNTLYVLVYVSFLSHILISLKRFIANIL